MDCCDGSSETGVYYVCPYTSEIVNDVTECETEESDNNESSIVDDMKIVYICPNTFEFVENIDDCPESLILESDNESEITQIIIDPESDESGNYTICEDGELIVINEMSCDDYVSRDEQQNIVSSEGSLDDTVLYISIAAILFCIISLLLVYKKASPDKGSKWVAQDIDKMFSQNELVPQALNWDTEERPHVSLKGENDGGYEWVEWPEGSDKHWYRAENTKQPWQRYKN